MQDGDAAKIEKDNGDDTTSQGFILGKYNPVGILKLVLEITGTANGKDYTGRTITKEFNFESTENPGLVNVAFTVNNIPKGLTLSVKKQ